MYECHWETRQKHRPPPTTIQNVRQRFRNSIHMQKRIQKIGLPNLTLDQGRLDEEGYEQRLPDLWGVVDVF
jgi:hypothetical protein